MWLGLALVFGGCGRIGFDAAAKASATDAGSGDPDGVTARCDRAQPFGAPVRLSALSSASAEIGVELTDDQLDGFLWSDRSGADTLYETTRASTTDTFGALDTLPALAGFAPAGFAAPSVGVSPDRDPCPSGDGLSVVFGSLRPGAGDWDLWLATRPTRTSPFAPPVALTSINTANANWGAYLTSSGLGLYYVEGTDLRVAYRANTTTTTFSAPTVLAELNTADAEFEPTVTPDELTILFASSRAGGQGGLDIWQATRASKSDAFSAPTAVSELNTTGDDIPSWISPDLCELYLTQSTMTNGWDLFVARRP